MLLPILLQLFFGRLLLGCPGSDWAEAGASCYHRSPQPISWREGNDYCRQQGGFMVEVNSEAEQQLITGMYGSENYHWIGLNQDQPGISTISLVRFDRLEWRVDMEGTNNS